MSRVALVNRSKKSRKKKIASLDGKKARAGWLFVLPFLIGLVIIYFPVIYNSIKFSFNTININRGGGYTLTFNGWGYYYEALIGSTAFIKVLWEGFKQLIFDIPAIVIFSLFVAIILNQKMIGRAAFRAIFFIPVILCTGLISEIDATNSLIQGMANTSKGIENGMGESTVAQIVNVTDISWLFSSMKVGTGIVTYVTSAINNIFDIINRSGVQMLIFLAALQSVSPAIYESCQIDGASGWETFWKITIPMISPMILVNTIYTVIDSFTSESNTVMAYISSVYSGSTNGRELSSAMSWIYFMMVLLIIGLVAALLSAYIFYQRRD